MFEKTGRLDSEHNHTPLHGQTSPPREKVRAVFWHQMSLLSSLDKSAQLGIHLVAETMRGGRGILRRGSGQKVVLGERVHRLGASSQILREMVVLVVVLRLGRGLLGGGGRRVG